MYDLSNNFGAVFTIGENNGTDVFGRDEEGKGVHARVRTRVVDNGDAIVDDDLPAEAHTRGDVAGSAGRLVGADLLTCVFRGPVARHYEALRRNGWAKAFVAHHAGDEVGVVGDGRFDEVGRVPGRGQHRWLEAIAGVRLG